MILKTVYIYNLFKNVVYTCQIPVSQGSFWLKSLFALGLATND